MHSEAHDRLVAETLERYRHAGAQSARFGTAMRAALRASLETPDDDGDDIDWILEDFRDSVPQPDVFIIDESNLEILCFECTHSNGIAPKLVRYARLWFDLDCYDWTLRLVEVFRGGAEHEVELYQVWYDRCLPARVEEMREESGP